MIAPILVVVGTRPEAIKLLPLFISLKERGLPTLLCATFQHDDLLQQVLDLFKVVPDISLNVMKKNQELAYLTAIMLEKITEVLNTTKPSLVLVQGDTASAFSAAMAAFYKKIPLGHIEAGLRTGNKLAPFPEEIYRRFITTVADYHFAPTSLAVDNLLHENINPLQIVKSGNTVVDALLFIKKAIDFKTITPSKTVLDVVHHTKTQERKLVLLTAHRRESFGQGLISIFMSIKKFAQTHPEILFYFPAHPNQQVSLAIQKSGLEEVTNIIIAPPANYVDLVYLLIHAHWVVTDSGGIQEETVSLGKKVIILRTVTDRMEAIANNQAVLVGSDEQKIAISLEQFSQEITCTDIQLNDIYGNGDACAIITTMIEEKFYTTNTYPQSSNHKTCMIDNHPATKSL